MVLLPPRRQERRDLQPMPSGQIKASLLILRIRSYNFLSHTDLNARKLGYWYLEAYFAGGDIVGNNLCCHTVTRNGTELWYQDSVLEHDGEDKSPKVFTSCILKFMLTGLGGVWIGNKSRFWGVITQTRSNPRTVGRIIASDDEITLIDRPFLPFFTRIVIQSPSTQVKVSRNLTGYCIVALVEGSNGLCIDHCLKLLDSHFTSKLCWRNLRMHGAIIDSISPVLCICLIPREASRLVFTSSIREPF